MKPERGGREHSWGLIRGQSSFQGRNGGTTHNCPHSLGEARAFSLDYL